MTHVLINPGTETARTRASKRSRHSVQERLASPKTPNPECPAPGSAPRRAPSQVSRLAARGMQRMQRIVTTKTNAITRLQDGQRLSSRGLGREGGAHAHDPSADLPAARPAPCLANDHAALVAGSRRSRAPDPIEPVVLEVGQTYELVLRVRATVLDQSDSHGRCYALMLVVRDFASSLRTVWLDQDELLVAVPEVPRPDAAAARAGRGRVVPRAQRPERRGSHRAADREDPARRAMSLVLQLRSYVDPDDHDEDRDAIRELMLKTATEIERMRQHVAACPLGYIDGRVIRGRWTTEAEIVAWIQKLHEQAGGEQ